MHQLIRPTISLSLLLLAACGGTKEGAGETGDSETGSGVTTTGLSMSSNPADEQPTSGSPATGSPTDTTSALTTAGEPGTTTDGGPGGTTADDPGGATTGASPPECQIEQPRPGSCDGGAPRQPAVKFAGQLAPRAGAHAALGKKGPDADDEEFATTGEGCDFICPPDVPGGKECDIFVQDCEPGEKCSAWADDGGNSWNSTRCVPVPADPDQIGEPCVAEGDGFTGIDSCAKGAMCWEVDDEGKGTCVEVCSCSEENPVCTTPNTTCMLSNEDVLALCLPVCDPLDASSCDSGEVCLTAGGVSPFFICVLDASGELGKAGDPCEFVNACDAGLVCADNSGKIPGCDPGADGCCTPFCDLAEASCPQGTSCTPWYAKDMAPKCFEDVGACM